MPEALTIARDDYTAAEFREAAAHSNDAGATRRILALALVLEGYKRGEAGKLCGMDRQTLRDGILRYNAEGIAVHPPTSARHHDLGGKAPGTAASSQASSQHGFFTRDRCVKTQCRW